MGSAPERSSEFEAEQRYFDDAREARERYRAKLTQAPAQAPHRGAAAGIRETVKDALEKLQDPDQAVAFGRCDTDDHEAWYVGFDAIWSTDADILVVNWQAPYAAPYYEATHADPRGLARKRSFECKGNTIIDFDDLVFREVAEDVARLLTEPTVDDVLLADLARERTGEMQEIVKTIQAAQYGVVRADLGQLLVVQGGPGTGKTAVGLHRVSWLLYNHRQEIAPEDVLIISPNRTFTRYIRNVLPTLGDQHVLHAELGGLLTLPVQTGREEDSDVAHLKGDIRMAGLIDRGLRQRVGIPDGPLELRAGGRRMEFNRSQLGDRLHEFSTLPYAEGRTAMRDFLRGEVQQQIGDTASRDEGVDNMLDRIWPQLTAASFLQDLLGSEGRLLRAAGSEFSAADVPTLYRKSASRLADETWAEGDIPLLDYADSRIRGSTPTQYAHIIVDEAQDLSPMQLEMISRRSPNGSMTVLGDLAQSTGSWARDSWDDVITYLEGDAPVSLVELEFGYRVPRQVFDVAATLLPFAAPHVTAPKVIRDGPADPTFLHVSTDERAGAAAQAAQSFAANGYLVGIISPAATRAEVENELDRRDVRWADASQGQLGSTITVLTPEGAKGLEFDAVVVVEPEDIITEDPRGYRMLYVALTRTTRHLTVVHSGVALPLDPARSPGSGNEGTRSSLEISTSDEAGDTESLAPMIRGVAIPIAKRIKQLVQPHLWADVLDELRAELLNED